MTVRRVLVTASRDWVHARVVWDALDEWLPEGDDVLVVIHGDCLSGGDRLAKRWVEKRQAEGYRVFEEAYPAEWEIYGKRAGMVRNQEMVDRGADACLAFPLPQSRGTIHCMNAAKLAGIPVKEYSPSGVSK